MNWRERQDVGGRVVRRRRVVVTHGVTPGFYYKFVLLGNSLVCHSDDIGNNPYGTAQRIAGTTPGSYPNHVSASACLASGYLHHGHHGYAAQKSSQPTPCTIAKTALSGISDVAANISSIVSPSAIRTIAWPRSRTNHLNIAKNSVTLPCVTSRSTAHSITIIAPSTATANNPPLPCGFSITDSPEVALCHLQHGADRGLQSIPGGQPTNTHQADRRARRRAGAGALLLLRSEGASSCVQCCRRLAKPQFLTLRQTGAFSNSLPEVRATTGIGLRRWHGKCSARKTQAQSCTKSLVIRSARAAPTSRKIAAGAVHQPCISFAGSRARRSVDRLSSPSWPTALGSQISSTPHSSESRSTI